MEKLRGRRQFEAVFASTTRAVVRPLFVARVLPRPDGVGRLGIVAGKKALRRAVDRNRAKRLVREAYRAMRCELLPVDLVVQVRSTLVGATAAIARAELAAIFQQIAQGYRR